MNEACYKPLSEQEIQAFYNALDKDPSGHVSFDALAGNLEQVHQDLAAQHKSTLNPAHHKRSEDDQTANLEEGHESQDATELDLRDFLSTLLPQGQTRLSKDRLCEQLRSWNVPSQSQTNTIDKEEAEAGTYEARLPFRRRIQAHLSVEAPKYFVMSLVVALQIAFAVQQFHRFMSSMDARHAFGAGVVIAKTASGAIYPTIFFMLLSMSRWLATYMRQMPLLARVVNWDVNQSFHILMSIACLAFATILGVCHLCVSFVYGSFPQQESEVVKVLGEEWREPTYPRYLTTAAGITGLVALVMFWAMFLLAMPAVRRRSYQIFQLSHLLMFPMIGLLCAHGAEHLLQSPMLGYWLAVPTVIVIIERLNRVLICGNFPMTGRMTMLDKDTVTLTIRHRRAAKWRYAAGQYVLIQIPSISYFQWHPFTVSSCNNERMSVHIKTEGDWTKQLRTLPTEEDIEVGVDGPFGAPAQRFYDFDRSIIIGAGIGVTPFSAILTDFERQLHQQKDPWAGGNRSRSLSPAIFKLPTSRRSSCSMDTGPFRMGQQSRGRSVSPTPISIRVQRAYDRGESPASPRRLTKHRRFGSSLSRQHSRQRSESPVSLHGDSQSRFGSSACLVDAAVADSTSRTASRSRAAPLPQLSEKILGFIPRHRSRPPAQSRGRHSRWSDDFNTKESINLASLLEPPDASSGLAQKRRVDFHWMVRERNSLSWFADLLNRVHALTESPTPLPSRFNTPNASRTDLTSLEKGLPSLNPNAFAQAATPHLELNINTYVTGTRKDIVSHVFRYLLDRHRTPSIPVSTLTGLKAHSQFSRPDFADALVKYHKDMVRQSWTGGKVGVFFCGNPSVGRVISDTCERLNVVARGDGSKIRYCFMMEVFG